MAKSLNKVMLIGNLGKDPDVKALPSGNPVVNFSLATSNQWKDKNGDKKEQTEWHSLVAYDRVAEIIRDYAQKGSKLYIEGRLATRSWEDRNTGQKMYRTEIIVEQVVLLSGGQDRRGDNAPAPAGAASGGSRSAASGGSRGSASGYGSAPSHDDSWDNTGITDDDIPF